MTPVMWMLVGLFLVGLGLTFYGKIIPWWEDKLEDREENRRRVIARMNREIELENRARIAQLRNGNAPHPSRGTTRTPEREPKPTQLKGIVPLRRIKGSR